jgi:hypothetical protein
LNPPGGMRTLPRMASGETKGTGFTITDRRSFTEEGASRAAPPDNDDVTEPHTSPDARTLPAVDFHTFVLSLGSSALLHLGELEHPDAGEKRQDLPLAKHTIDILAMLEEKTRGNLTGPEEKLIQSLLYDLRLRYVELTTKPGP